MSRLLAQWDKPDPYTVVENSGRKNTQQALRAELEQNMKGKGFPSFAEDMLRQMIDRLYVSYDKWDGFFPDMPDKHTFIRVHLIDIIPKIQEIRILEEGSEDFEEVIELYGEFTAALSDGENIKLMGDHDWTPEEDGQYSTYTLGTILHEIQHVAQNDIMYSEYFDSSSPEWKLRYPFVEGGASFYAAFLDEPGTSDDGFSVSDHERWLTYRCSCESSESYGYWTKYIEKIVWFLGFKTVGKVFAAQPFTGFKEELADRYGRDLSEKWLHALEEVAHNYYPYAQANEDEVIINQIIHLERLFTNMLEQKIDALDSRADVWNFIDTFRRYRTWFVPTMDYLGTYETSDCIDGFIGLHRASKRLTAKIEKYNLLHFSDDAALNSEVIRTLLCWRLPKRFTSMQYAFLQTETYGKLYVKTKNKTEKGETKDCAAYQVDASGNRRYYSYSASETRYSLLNHKETNLQEYYALSHFSPKEEKGKVYTQWKDTQDWPISQKAPTRRHITFGAYPQTQIKDKALIKQLNALPVTWTVIHLIVDEDGDKEGDVKARIADVTLNGKRYRAAQLSYNEEEYDYLVSDEEYPYSKGKIYWFAFEPLTWTVINEKKGIAVCDQVIDFEPFQTNDVEAWDQRGTARRYTDETQTHYRNQFAYASIRKWLNGAFVSAAFNADEQKQLRTAVISNDPCSGLFSEFGTQPTKDRVFLPSIAEMTDSAQGFSPYVLTQDAGRTASYTDYARLLSFSAYETDYVLRTPGDVEYEYTMVAENGGIHLSYSDDGYGIRPAVCADLKQF